VDFHLKQVFRHLFRKKPDSTLAGAPAVRRLKTYSAQSGYVYQYFYEGHRRVDAPSGGALEFVFRASADRKNWNDLSVLIDDCAIRAWEQAHSRELSATEHYAIAKIALFQAFDERQGPAQMRDPVRVRNADIDGIVETLGL
jgi:hypothetical protein